MRMERRSWPRYCMWTIGICLGLELLFTEGRGPAPVDAVPAVAVDGLRVMGCTTWSTSRSFGSEKRAEEFALTASASRYTTRCAKPLRDFSRVHRRGTAHRRTTVAALRATPRQRILDRLLYRSEGRPTTPRRTSRSWAINGSMVSWNCMSTCLLAGARQQSSRLFLLAHKAFILNDRENYVLNHLKTEKKR